MQGEDLRERHPLRGEVVGASGGSGPGRGDGLEVMGGAWQRGKRTQLDQTSEHRVSLWSLLCYGLKTHRMCLIE